ncbi:hypothetical protein [Arthrobacter roseus]|uniref:hypothetical protein n=1 Tax=Arthrobacter roseus TaxID=136274 RepID=UPI0019668379|nr:hypothetical protein [Arthrobacter roseus]MBM7849121.1 hypothetical protein [Arthrobacter roseus]
MNQAMAAAASGATATGLGSWPGNDPREANRVVRGELGTPNLPHVVELPHRGPGADPTGRSAAMLVDLAVDLQPHGWRIIPRAGREHRRAVSLLKTDVDTLADDIGVNGAAVGELKTQLLGPLSLTSGLYLPSGERALRDAGARRDLAQSLAAGAAEHVGRVMAAAPGAQLTVQLDEPRLSDVLHGRIPTASGYRMLRAVPRLEALEAWAVVVSSLKSAGAHQVLVSAAGVNLPFKELAETFDGLAVPASSVTDHEWESLAEMLEAGRFLWLGVGGVGPLPQVSTMVRSVIDPWNRTGLDLDRFKQLRLTPDVGLAERTPTEARMMLGRLSSAADALNQVMAEG